MATKGLTISQLFRGEETHDLLVSSFSVKTKKAPAIQGNKVDEDKDIIEVSGSILLKDAGTYLPESIVSALNRSTKNGPIKEISLSKKRTDGTIAIADGSKGWKGKGVLIPLKVLPTENKGEGVVTIHIETEASEKPLATLLRMKTGAEGTLAFTGFQKELELPPGDQKKK